MQVISENENKGSYGRETNIVDFVIYIGRNSRCMKRKYVRRFRSSGGRI